MKEERIKKLEEELKYLVVEEVKKEIVANEQKLKDETIPVQEIAKDIYLKRGLDITKVKDSFLNNLIYTIGEVFNVFKGKDSKVRNKMLLELIYVLLLVVLMKIPFDLVRDIGYEYIELLTTSSLFNTLWNLAFLMIYTITILCTLVVCLRNFNKKYRNTK